MLYQVSYTAQTEAGEFIEGANAEHGDAEVRTCVRHLCTYDHVCYTNLRSFSLISPHANVIPGT